MSESVIDAKILEWGNSYGIRIKKADLEREGLEPGEEVAVRIERRAEPIDLSDLPTFSGGQSDVSDRHDAYLAEGLAEEMSRSRSMEGEDEGS